MGALLFQLLLLLVASAWGGSKKVEKLLAQHAAGKPGALVAAESAAAKLVQTAPDDPVSWLLAGEVALVGTVTTDPRGVAAGQRAIEAFEQAERLGVAGALHAALSSEVDGLWQRARGWTEAAQGLDRRDDATLAFGLLERVQALDVRLAGSRPDRAALVHALGVSVSAAAGDGAAAAEQYGAWVAAAGRGDAALAVLVARSLKGTEAMAFLDALPPELLEDPALLGVDVEARMAAGSPASAAARIEAVSASYETPEELRALAELWSRAQEEERARAAWEQLVAVAPKDVHARIALGRSWLGEAISAREEVEARAEELDARKPPADLVELVARLPSLWGAAERAIDDARRIDVRSEPALVAAIALYQARIAGLGPETGGDDEQEDLAADLEKLRVAKAALDALRPSNGDR